MVISGEHLTRLDDGTYKCVIEVSHREIVIIIHPNFRWEVSQRSALHGQTMEGHAQANLDDCLTQISSVVTALLLQPF